MWPYREGERCAQGSSGDTRGKDAIMETQNRCVDNIKMDLQRVVGWSLDGVGSGWVQVAETCE
jgi:hypothetical protein